MFDLFKVLEQQLNGFGNGTYFETVFIDNKWGREEADIFLLIF